MDNGECNDWQSGRECSNDDGFVLGVEQNLANEEYWNENESELSHNIERFDSDPSGELHKNQSRLAGLGDATC